MKTEEEIKVELSFYEGYLAGMNDDWSLDEKKLKRNTNFGICS